MISPDLTSMHLDAGPTKALIGERVREARERNRLSMRDVAARAGVSAGFISQIENGKSGVSVAALKRIAAALGVSVADLLSERIPDSRQVLRAHERPVFVSDGGVTKLLLSRLPIHQLEVYVGFFEVGGSTGEQPYAHDVAQEMFYVQSGHVQVEVGEETHIMGPADTLEYLSNIPHRATNIGATPAEVLWITSHLTPPKQPELPSPALPPISAQSTGQASAHLDTSSRPTSHPRKE